MSNARSVARYLQVGWRYDAISRTVWVMKLCVIAARAGSKGLPGKNSKMFVGKPLLAHSIEQAKISGVFDYVALSSDSEIYLGIGREAGADLLIERPKELASDLVGKPPVLSHALRHAEELTGNEFSIFCDLQPTSPLRTTKDILGAVEKLTANPELKNVVSVCTASGSPYYTLLEEREDGCVNNLVTTPTSFSRRQDLPRCLELNGSIYVWRRESILQELPAVTENTGYWLMEDACNFDIDTDLDFSIAEFVAKHHFGWGWDH